MPWTPSQIPSQREKHAIVTGANSGIGYFTALELARAGAHVVLACRGSKGDDAAKRICQEIPEARVSGAQLDLADLSSVRTFAAAQDGNPLDLLINNAGVMAIPTRTFTKDGFETQFGTNHLGHFALTALLLPSLLASPSPRVTVVSSGAHKMGKIDFDNLQGERSYSAWGAYCQSKLANLLFMLELQRQAKLAGSSLLCTGDQPPDQRTRQIHVEHDAPHRSVARPRRGPRRLADGTRRHRSGRPTRQLLWTHRIPGIEGKSSTC
jgi:NAD(P)-dependent dehydrogenase (short-subunit alcohol dehydrogenase family)